MKKILIFGINGFVGTYLLSEFKNHGYEVVGSDIHEKYKAVDCNKDIDYFSVDITDKSQVERVLLSVNPDGVINLAAISSVGLSWEMPKKTIEVNLIGTINILEAIKDYNIKTKVILIGSSEEYLVAENSDNTEILLSEKMPLDSNNPYGISKVAQEQFADIYRKRYGMDICCVRAFNHTGIGQSDAFVLPSFCKQIAEICTSNKNGAIYVGNLNISRDFSDVRDIVRAYRMIYERDTHLNVFNVGSGIAYNLRELLDYLISLCDCEVEVIIDKKKLRPCDSSVIKCDNTLIVNTLGWHPQYSIYDTLNEMIEYYKKVCD